jgi:D-glycero-alpha-D-manno-heptose 1-phosphate guanylyltransferase
MSERPSLSQLTAVILAGGLGTRLRSVVQDRPKVLAEIHGRPFLAYLLDQLESEGIQHVVLCTGYMSEQVERALGCRYGRLVIEYSTERSPLGTGGSLRQALPLARSSTVLCMNGDSWCEADLAHFYRFHNRNGLQASILLTKVPDVRRYGQVEMGEFNRILRFREKSAESGPGLINSGVYLLERALVAAIPAGRAVSLEREMFPGWVKGGIQGFPSDGRFIDIGTPESYSDADAFFSKVFAFVENGMEGRP